jgi:hypothetical protein
MRAQRTAALVALAAASLTFAAAAEAAGSRCGSPGIGKRELGALPPGKGEVSGLAASHRLPGVGWMIRDSGKPASLYSLRLDGSRPRVHEIPVIGAHNRNGTERLSAAGRAVLTHGPRARRW